MDINITNPVTTAKIGEVVNGANAATPNDTDLLPIVDTAVTKKITLTNFKAFLKTYFDTLYTGGSSAWGSITGTLSAQTDLQNALNNKEPLKGADDNYVTDAQLTVIQNTSGTNTGDQDLSGLQATSAKDATGGYVGLTLFKINFKNVLNTFTSFFTNSNTAARTYTFPDKDGTVAMTSDALSYQPIFSGKYRTQPYVGNVGTSGGFNGLIYFMQYFTGKPHTILSISMNCTSSVAGTSIRLAIYNQTNGVPTTLIEESGTIDCSTSGMKIFTFSSPIALTDEVYFFAIQSSASTVALSYLVTANTSLILMRPNATELNSYSKTQAYGAFPNPVVTPGSSTSQPIIYAITQ
jgi:hypothetical protein